MSFLYLHTAFKPARGNSRRSLLVSARKTATKEPATVTSTDADIGPAGLAAIVAGAVCNPVMLYSEYVLQTTGAGLPPGPGGLYGAIGKKESAAACLAKRGDQVCSSMFVVAGGRLLLSPYHAAHNPLTKEISL